MDPMGYTGWFIGILISWLMKILQMCLKGGSFGPKMLVRVLGAGRKHWKTSGFHG